MRGANQRKNQQSHRNLPAAKRGGSNMSAPLNMSRNGVSAGGIRNGSNVRG